MIMRMKYDNISCVHRFDSKGITYAWHVSMKSYNVSDGRSYYNTENGVSVIKEYPIEWLPKTVQKFIANHSEAVLHDWSEDTLFEVIEYIIK